MALILGGLAAIALPDFLAAKPGKVCAIAESWAKTIVGSTIKVQKAYHTEQGEFTASIQQVEDYSGIQDLQTKDDWRFLIQKQENMVSIYATALPPALVDASLYSYVAAVAYDPETGDYISIICKTTQPSSLSAKAPILERKRRFLFGRQRLQWRCAKGSHDC